MPHPSNNPTARGQVRKQHTKSSIPALNDQNLRKTRASNLLSNACAVRRTILNEQGEWLEILRFRTRMAALPDMP